MADAIIFQSAIDHVSNENYEKAYFVTENYKDFSKAGINHEIDERLAPMLPSNLTYEINIDKVIFEIVKSTGIKIFDEKENLAMIARLEEAAHKKELKIDLPHDILDCPRCKEKLSNRSDGRWNSSIYGGGLSWWRSCKNCGLEWDSGEYFD